MKRRTSALRRGGIPAVLVLLSAACGGSPGPGTLGPASEPAGSVERFLEASQTRDLETMGRIFGTADGSHLYRAERTFRCGMRRMVSLFRLAGRCPTAQEVEVRMDALAQVLEHEAFSITGESRVAGREDPTMEVRVTLDGGDQRVEDVPFVTVQADGVWYVQEIDVERVTAPRD